RSAGSSVEVLAHADGYTDLRMGSKEVRKVLSSGLATIGQVSNPDYNLVNIGKAGKSRGLGIRPTVRWSVMNPVDHPYGGGEGRQPRGTKRPKTMWGKVTGGRKTRHPKKWSTKFILTRRPKIR
ncbi:MAG TPA: 50S ribosomal protein L2, partial [Candidatus Omnitrophota bacterium]|nr:50S ribosomal protein L2 [Candidatus Omnitrophota bacterium]